MTCIKNYYKIQFSYELYSYFLTQLSLFIIEAAQ